MNKPEFEIRPEDSQVDGRAVAILRVVGEVDLANAGELTEQLLSERCRGADAVLLDLSNLDFMDSSGLRSVLIAAEELPCPIVTVVAPGSSVSRLLDLAEVGDRVRRFPDDAAALAALEPGK
jgi:anti-sigma B factor antagonist